MKIDHGNGYVTYYGHNSSLLVSVGEHVHKGQQIARMGSTGISSGNHCDFRIQRGIQVEPRTNALFALSLLFIGSGRFFIS